MTEKEKNQEERKRMVREFLDKLEVFIDLPTGEWDGKPKQTE